MAEAQRGASTRRALVMPWLATVGLTLSALFAATGFIAPICYWQGRLLSRDRGGATPLAWASEAAPVHATMFGFAVVWVVLWFIHSRRVRRHALSMAHAVAPIAVFAVIGWQQSMMAYACNIF